MTLTPDFPEPDSPEPDAEGFAQDSDALGADALGADENLPELPDDFVVPDDLSELDTLPPASHHEDPDGTQWDDPDWLAAGNDSAGEAASGDSSAGGTALAEPNLLGGDELPHNTMPEFADFVPAAGVPAAGAPGGLDLDAELAEMTGDKYELVMLLTPVADARALAAACALIGINAIALPNPSGAVAVLSNTTGDEPEKGATALSNLLPAFPVLLLTKASGQLTATRFVAGQPPQEVPAGLLVAGASGIVEDLIIGQTTPEAVAGAVSSVGVSRTKALMWLSKLARRRNK